MISSGVSSYLSQSRGPDCTLVSGSILRHLLYSHPGSSISVLSSDYHPWPMLLLPLSLAGELLFISKASSCHVGHYYIHGGDDIEVLINWLILLAMKTILVT